MSEPRLKLHWVTAVIESLKTLKDMFLPFIILTVANGFGRNADQGWFAAYGSLIFVGVLAIILLISGIVKWKRFEYWFEDDELRIESGLFVRKKRYIPFDRIQSLDYTEGIFHRPLKLVKVKVETAGNSSVLKSEAELTAVTKDAAARIEEELAAAKKRKFVVPVVEGEGVDIEEIVEEVVTPARSIFTMTTKDLLLLATTSGGIGLILSGVAIFLSQFAELIPFERMYEEVSAFIKIGLIIIAIAVFLGFLLVWGISVAMTYLAYYGFNVSLDKEDIVITRGLIEKKRATVPLNRVQCVRVIENPFRQLFGYATVVIENAGGGLKEGATINLFPLVKKTHINGPLKEIFPNLIIEKPTYKLPTRSKYFYYRIDFLWIIPVIGALTYFFFPYGLLSLLLIPIVVLFGLWQHRSAAYDIFDHQLTLRFRRINLHTAYLTKNRIQSMEMKQNYFHRRKHVATLSGHIKSGMGAFNAQVNHMEQKEAERILAWYEPSNIKEQEL